LFSDEHLVCVLIFFLLTHRFTSVWVCVTIERQVSYRQEWWGILLETDAHIKSEIYR